MGFWGIEVKPGKPHPYHSDNVPGRLHITQATLGPGSSKEKSILQCSIGHKSPIYLCSLLPNKNECCTLNLEFEDDDDLVAFSVIGPQSIHLSGYFVSDNGDYIRDEYDTDSYGEDIDETGSEESSEYDTEDEYEDDFIDDDDDIHMYAPSPVPNRGVVIEEIVDEEKPTNGIQSKRVKKRNQSSDNEQKNNSQQQIGVKSGGSVPVLESEDEDGFPTSASDKMKVTFHKSKAEANEQTDKIDENKVEDVSDHATGKKRKVKISDQDDHLERKKKKKKQKEKGKEGKVNEANATSEISEPSKEENQPLEEMSPNLNQVSSIGNKHDEKHDKSPDIDEDTVPNDNLSEKKKKKKKKKKKTQEAEGGTNMDKNVSDIGDENKFTEEKQTETKSSRVRSYPNGLIIEELAMGKPDGKRASLGKQISVRYIGKLKKNGKIFDSNVGRAPFKFRLGVGQVIKGWDVGLTGMRIGDKRRLTIPPSMGYGERGAGGKIPPNSCLMFDVELVDVR